MKVIARASALARLATIWCAALLLLGFGSIIAVHDEARGAGALAALAPAVGGLAGVGSLWMSDVVIVTTAVAAGAAALLVVLAWRLRRTAGAAVALGATAVAVVGQSLVLTGVPEIGAVLLVVAALAVAVGGAGQQGAADRALSGAGAKTTWCEVGALIAVLATAAALLVRPARRRLVGGADGGGVARPRSP